MKSSISLILAMSLGWVSAGCSKHDKPNFIFMPDMVYGPGYKAQELGPELKALLKAPKGTVSRDYQAVGYDSETIVATYPEFENAEAAGRALKNPSRRSRAVLERGRQVYNYTCMACHGAMGEGDGGVVSRGYPRPPSLQSDKIRGWADGSLFHVITRGQNLMPSYAAQIRPLDRWAVIQYVRVLQRAKKPTPEDIQAFEKASK